MKSIVKIAQIRNEALKILSQDFLNAIVCSGKHQREAYFFMKKKTDKNSLDLMELLKKARDIAEELTKPSIEDKVKVKFENELKIKQATKVTYENKQSKLEKNLVVLSKQIENKENECIIALGSAKKSCIKELKKLQEQRKNMKKDIEVVKANVFDQSVEVDKVKSEINKIVTNIYMNTVKKSSKEVNEWLLNNNKQMQQARKLSGKLVIEEKFGCGLYQRSVHEKRQMIDDRVIVLRSRRNEVFDKFIKMLKKEERAIRRQIDNLSKSADKHEKMAIKLAKYESQGVFTTNERSERMKTLANEERKMSADIASGIIYDWRQLAQQQENEIKLTNNEIKRIQIRKREIEDGVMKIDTNITIAILKSEIQELKFVIKSRNDLANILYSLINGMTDRKSVV